jgi:hypothetical protein
MQIKVEKLPDGTNNLLITDDEGSGQYRIPLSNDPSSGPSQTSGRGYVEQTFDAEDFTMYADGISAWAAFDDALPDGAVTEGVDYQIIEEFRPDTIDVGYPLIAAYGDHDSEGVGFNEDVTITVGNGSYVYSLPSTAVGQTTVGTYRWLGSEPVSFLFERNGTCFANVSWNNPAPDLDQGRVRIRINYRTQV